MISYNPADTTVVFNGAILTDFAPGSMVEVSRRADSFNLVIGANGNGIRIKINDKSAEVTVNLLQSSPSNDVLSAFMIADEASGVATGSLLIKNKNTILAGANAFLLRPADVAFASDDQSTRTWVFIVEKLGETISGD